MNFIANLKVTFKEKLLYPAGPALPGPAGPAGPARKAHRLLKKLTAPFTIQAYGTVYYIPGRPGRPGRPGPEGAPFTKEAYGAVYYTSLPHRLLYKFTAPLLYPARPSRPG